eukprot:gene7397-9432_t
MSEPTPYIFDVTTATFDQAVIENSFHKPVLVDFWAEWCAPCKALMPLLAQIAESYQGELLLAKVDCEAEQDVVARFGIRSLPTVVLFKDGQPVDGFAGAKPESEIRALLEPHVQMPPPAEADPLEQAQALFAGGRISEAEAVLVALLGEDNTNAAALILVHNHPSGDPKPSRDDIEMTREIKTASEALGITIHDHLVIGRKGHASFRSLG